MRPPRRHAHAITGNRIQVSRRTLVILVAVGFVMLMAFAGTVLALMLALGGGAGWGIGDRIAVLEIEGVITDDDEYLENIRRFRDDPSVKGFLVVINSPGGVVGPSQSLYRELQRIREEDGRPVVASIGGVGASGGYYVALGADSIFALPGSLTGSIGVIMEFPDIGELMQRVGVGMHVIKSAEHKDIGSPYRALSEPDRQVLEALVQDVYEQFVDAVATERGLERDVAYSLADGRIFSGRQALEYGLVDRIGNFHDALAAVGRMAGLGDRPRIVEPPEPRFTLFDLLMGRGATQKALAALQPLEQVSGGPRLKFTIF